MNGDGHHSDLPIFRPSVTPEVLGEVMGLLRGIVREEVQAAMQHPPLVDLSYLVWYSQTSESTVRRTIEKLSIPRRNMHGGLWKEGDGPVRFSFSEWEAACRLSTRTITNEIRRSKR